MTEHYDDAAAAFRGPFEPRTPCRVMETRACVDLFDDPPDVRMRVEPCPPRGCRRFPGRDEDAAPCAPAEPLDEELGSLSGPTP